MLFVGESPPASGRFFYQADSGLYRAMRRTFLRALPALDGADFLQSFRECGCYLVDLCAKPVDRLTPQERRRACVVAEVGLSEAINVLRPKVMVVFLRSITPNVRRAAQLANWNGGLLELPYPGRWQRHRVAFERALLPVLRRELEKD
ncbi:MAG TPA: hypothetical protein VII25_08565 [Candidatus Acidoferrum sp.]